MTRVAAIILSGAAALLSACAHAPAPAASSRTVESEGWTPYDKERPLESRRRALAEAQKKAVEEAAGVSVKARTRVEAAVTSEQRIEANVGGDIRRYDVLSEKVEDGFMKVRIRAVVALEKPEPARLDPAAVAVAIDAASGARAAVRSALTAKGFRLSEAPDADVVITADASGHEVVDARTAGFRSYRARVSLKGIARGGGQEFEASGEASALDEALESARKEAESQAAQAAAEVLGDKLLSGFAPVAARDR